MELILGPANVETFLLKLIVSYLKLEERSKIKVIALSDVRDPSSSRLPPRLSNWETLKSMCLV